MGTGYELFRVQHVAVRVHKSLVLLAILLGLLALSAGGTPAQVGLRLLAPLILFLTTLVHELGHAFTARRLGVAVHDVMLTPLGGAARLHGQVETPRLEGAIAAAGPVTNLTIAGLLYVAGLAFGRIEPGAFASLFDLGKDGAGLVNADPFRTALVFNLALGILNLIPAFPMDGGRIFRALLWTRLGKLIATRIACRIGMWFAAALILAPFFLNGAEWWVLVLVGFTIFGAALRERIAVEASEGLFSQGFRVFRTGEGGAGFGFPPEGSGAPGGNAGPASPDFIDDSSNVIDVTAESRIVDRENED